MSGLRTLLAALVFAGGIVLADLLRPGAMAAAGAGAVGTAFLVLAAILHLRNPEPGWGMLLPAVSRPAIVLLCSGLAACGFCSLGLRLAALESALVPGYAGRSVQVAGFLANDPRPYGDLNRFLLAVREADGKPVREKLAVTAYGRLPEMNLGDTIRVTAKIRSLEESDPFDMSLARKSVVAKGSVSAAEVRVLSPSQNRALTAANHFRSRISSAAASGAGKSAGLVLGLVLGDQREIPQGVIDDFRAAGLSHLTAVSGQNVAMVMGPLVLIMSALRVGRRAQAAAGLVTLALFALVTRWEPSVLRAVLMASAALCAWLFGRRSNPFHLLCLVFFALLAIDPLLLWSIGFQLSFAATAGILVLGPALSRKLGRPFIRLDEQTDEEDRRPRRLLGRVTQVAAIGISAQAAVLPLIAFHFGKLSLVALPANLLALPLVAPVTILGLCAGVVGSVSVRAAEPFMFAAGFLASGLRGTARLFGGSAYAQASVDGWSFVPVLGVCLAVGAAGLLLSGKARPARWLAVGCSLLVVTSGLFSASGSATPPGMRLHFFDVGQGDAALIQGPSGERIVVDGGPDAGFVARRLKGMGISRLDLVLASHAHVDHVQGLKRVLDGFEVREALEPGILTPVMQEIRIAGGKSRRPFRAVGDGDKMRIGKLTIHFLGPAASERRDVTGEDLHASSESEGSALNDASVVARISFGHECALFPGDLEEEGQAALLEAHPEEIDCTVLKAPHHGSGRLLPEFIEAVDPEWVTVSAGRGNDYGHPAPKALSIFRSAGARVVRTDRVGDIVLDVDGDGSVTIVQ